MVRGSVLVGVMVALFAACGDGGTTDTGDPSMRDGGERRRDFGPAPDAGGADAAADAGHDAVAPGDAAPPPDARTAMDVAPRDAAIRDSAPPDGPPPDAGPCDAGPLDAAPPDATPPRPTVADCFAGMFARPSPIGPDYDQFGPVVGRHCMGTDHQEIEGIERVVFLGDSVTVGTPRPRRTSSTARCSPSASPRGSACRRPARSGRRSIW